eukprot:m.418992 g.418992  ORF g.418992 m.418992 type:complete len:67 (-) comp21297_c0_seq5:1883-2083(-)
MVLTFVSIQYLIQSSAKETRRKRHRRLYKCIPQNEKKSEMLNHSRASLRSLHVLEHVVHQFSLADV